jgi:hypothetical protein
MKRIKNGPEDGTSPSSRSVRPELGDTAADFGLPTAPPPA